MWGPETVIPRLLCSKSQLLISLNFDLSLATWMEKNCKEIRPPNEEV